MRHLKSLVLILVGIGIFQFSDAQTSTKSTTQKVEKKADDITGYSWRKNKKLAKKSLKKGNYYDAVQYLEAGYTKKPKKKYFAENLGKAETELRNYADAAKWYKVLVDRDSVKHKKPQYSLGYANSLKNMGKYDEATAYYKQFVRYSKDNEKSAEAKKYAKRENEGAKKGVYLRDSVEKRDFKAKLSALNNEGATKFGTAFKDDNTMYYSSLNTNNMKTENGIKKYTEFARIYKATRNGKDWSLGVAISDNINAEGKHIMNPAFNENGDVMYYNECTQNATGKMQCKIMYSKMVNGIWEKGESVSASINDGFSDNITPAVGKNKEGENVLFFASNRNIEKGYDLYMAKIANDGSVEKPRNMGSAVNTKMDEKSPFYDPATGTFYYSSNGRINIGGFDVYKTALDNGGEWLDPENAGLPINSSADDLYFTLNRKGTKGAVSSNRTTTDGAKTTYDNLYLLETTKVFLAVRGNIYEVEGEGKALANDVVIELKDEKNGDILQSTKITDGTFVFPLTQNLYYNLYTQKSGYLNSEVSFNTEGKEETDTLSFDLFVKKKAEVNPLIGRIIGRVYYDYDKSKLRADALDSLKKVEDIMKQYENYIIEVGGHTDSKGSEAYNEGLSLRRADAVANYLIYDKKLPKSRFVLKPYAFSQPAAPNTYPDGKDNPEGRALNRRTEFKIIEEIKKQ